MISTKYFAIGPYKLELIGTEHNGIASNHFRIADSQDNAIGFCYLRENAELIVDAMNKRHALMVGGAADRDGVLE